MARHVSAQWREGQHQETPYHEEDVHAGQHQDERGESTSAALDPSGIRGNKGNKPPPPVTVDVSTPTYAPTGSDSPIPIIACLTCQGRRWRLRSTPKTGGEWLWLCATCADYAEGISQGEGQAAGTHYHTPTEAPQ